MIAFAFLFIAFCFGGFAVAGVIWLLPRLLGGRGNWSWRKRAFILGVGTAVLTTCNLAFEVRKERFLLAHVPRPLEVESIEYRRETAPGYGLPGDNETGFIVYRLTDSSARWLRDEEGRSGSFLPLGSWNWNRSPVDDRTDARRWHPNDDEPGKVPHGASIAEYLDRYGFGSPLDAQPEREANRAIRTPGSFYAYGRGGSVTIIDPKAGKVYFAYAG